MLTRRTGSALAAALVATALGCGGRGSDAGAGDGSDAAAPEAGGTDAGPPAGLVIRHVRVVDADGVRPDQRVQLAGGLVAAVEADVGALPGSWAGVEEIDGTGMSLVPGLTDAHVHTHNSSVLPGTGSFGNLTPEHMRAFVWCGVTSIIDAGGPSPTPFEMRARVAAGEMWGPRAAVVGRFLTKPGGHPCDGFFSDATCAFVADAASAPAAVASAAAPGPDLLKVIIESALGVLPRKDLSEIQAIVTAAEALGLRVFAHVSAGEDFDDAIAAGVHALAHIPFRDVLDPAQIAAIAAAGIPAVTTISFVDAYGRYVDDQSFIGEPGIVAAVPAEELAAIAAPGTLDMLLTSLSTSVDLARAYEDVQKMNLAALHAAGVPILAGTDSGNFAVFHGPGLWRELLLMVEAGLTPLEALRAATLEPALFLGDATRGLVAPGYVADLVLVAGDPSVDILALSAVDTVFIGGERPDRDALTAADPPLNLLRSVRALDPGELCIDDAECGAGFACEPFLRLCTELCDLAGPVTCAAGVGCIDSGGRGFCWPGDGCTIGGNDCPFASVYGTSCVDGGNGAAYCL